MVKWLCFTIYRSRDKPRTDDIVFIDEFTTCHVFLDGHMHKQFSLLKSWHDQV
jgi:hypothetical protein